MKNEMFSQILVLFSDIYETLKIINLQLQIYWIYFKIVKFNFVVVQKVCCSKRFNKNFFPTFRICMS